MKNLSIFILEHFFLSLISLREAKQSICRSISFFLMIIYLKVVLRELLSLADLIRAQVFYIYELTEIVMVNKDKNFVFATFQVVVPSLKPQQ